MLVAKSLWVVIKTKQLCLSFHGFAASKKSYDLQAPYTKEGCAISEFISSNALKPLYANIYTSIWKAVNN